MVNMQALKRALNAVQAVVDEADVQALRKRRGGAEVEIEVKPGGGGPESCPECKAGMCAEHMSEEDAAGLEEMYGGGE